MLRSEPQGDIGLRARAEERHAGYHLRDHSQGKVSVHLQWLQEAGTRSSEMGELWRTKVGGTMQEAVIGLQLPETRLRTATLVLDLPWNERGARRSARCEALRLFGVHKLLAMLLKKPSRVAKQSKLPFNPELHSEACSLILSPLALFAPLQPAV
jgi:hypothetical protein